MSRSMTPTRPESVLRSCHQSSDTSVGPHAPHGWHGRICPGLDEIGALTFTQVEVIAAAIDMDPWALATKLLEAHGANQ